MDKKYLEVKEKADLEVKEKAYYTLSTKTKGTKYRTRFHMKMAKWHKGNYRQLKGD